FRDGLTRGHHASPCFANVEPGLAHLQLDLRAQVCHAPALGSAGTAQRSASMPRPAAVEESPREAEADAAEVLPIENLVFEVRVAAGDRELRQEPCALGSGAQSERFGASRNRAELRTALECAFNETLQRLRGKNGINRNVL